MSYATVMQEIATWELEDLSTLRHWLNNRIPIVAAEAEWARQQTCPHTDAKEYGAADHRYWYCPACKLRQDKGLTRSAR
jgi:hypothetical protein